MPPAHPPAPRSYEPPVTALTGQPSDIDLRSPSYQAMERDLRLARDRYERMLHLAPDPYLVTDLNAVVRTANQPALDLLGIPDTRVAHSLMLSVPRADRGALQRLVREARVAGRLVDRRLRIRRDGDDIAVSASLSVFPAGGAPPTEIHWILRDITETVEREAALAEFAAHLEQRVAERTQELQEANRVKDEFLSLVSHELRSPITVILGGTEFLLRHTEMVAPAAAELVQDCHTEATRLSRLIDDLLLLARAERDNDAEHEPLRVRPVVAAVAADHQHRFPQRRIVVDGRGLNPIAAGSSVFLEQIVRNLVSNAEKYSPPDQPIEINLASADGEVIIEVADHGTGLSDDEIAHLFEPFYRAPRTAHVQGIGIGLTVCKRLAEKQHGRVWARHAEAGGMVFGCALPAWPGGDDDEL